MPHNPNSLPFLAARSDSSGSVFYAAAPTPEFGLIARETPIKDTARSALAPSELKLGRAVPMLVFSRSVEIDGPRRSQTSTWLCRARGESLLSPASPWRTLLAASGR